MSAAVFDAIGFTAVFKNMRIWPAIDGRTALSSGDTDMLNTAIRSAVYAVFAFDDRITHSIVALVAITGTTTVAANQAIIPAIDLTRFTDGSLCLTSACIGIIYIT